MEWAWPVIVVMVVLAGALLFTPYEAALEGVTAFVMVTIVIAGFLMRPRREVFYVRTTVPRIDPSRNRFLEHDLLAVRVDLVRLWLLFVATGGLTQFSFLNWFLSSRHAPIALFILEFAPLLVLLLTAAWIQERWVLRDAEACSARSFSVSQAQLGRAGHVSYLFMGERGEYYGGYCFCIYLALDQPRELATIVLYDVRKPQRNKIAMGFLFHRLTVLGRGVTDLDKETQEAQRILAETTS